MNTRLTNMKRRGFLLASAGLLAGCGGGGSAVSRSAPGLKLDLVWPARSRSLDVPAGALSAVVTLESIGGGGTNFPAIDRETSAAGYTQTWTSPQAVPTGVVRLAVNFYAQRGGGGAILGTAAKTVVIASDGTGAGTIAVTGKIASIAVTGPASVRAGDAAAYAISASDASGATLAVAAGAATFALDGGADILSVAADGAATGLSVGSAGVKATLGGLSAPTLAVSVTAPTGAKAIFAAGQTVDYGKKGKLAASVIDAAGKPVTIDPSLVSFTVVTGADVLAVDSAGNASGLKVGQASVRYKAGDLSATATVSVTADILVSVDPLQSVAVGASGAIAFHATDRAGAPLPLGTGGVPRSKPSPAATSFRFLRTARRRARRPDSPP